MLHASQASCKPGHAVARHLISGPEGIGEPIARGRGAWRSRKTSTHGLYDVLGGWAKVPGIPEADLAARIRAALFPDGLKFIQIAYKLEWAESNTRLLHIREQHLGPELDKIGVASILVRLEAAHQEYGEALGITTVPMDDAAAAEVKSLRDALLDFVGALRMYVVRVSGMPSKRDPMKEEISAMLLAPIERWETPAPRAKPAEPSPGAPQGGNDEPAKAGEGEETPS